MKTNETHVWVVKVRIAGRKNWNSVYLTANGDSKEHAESMAECYRDIQDGIEREVKVVYEKRK